MENLPTHEDNLPTYEEATNKTNNPPSYKETSTNINLQTRLSHTQPTSDINIQQYIEDQENADFTTVHSNQVNNNIDIAILVTILTIVSILVYLLFKRLS